MLDWLEEIAAYVQPFRELYSQAQPPDRSKIQIPDELTKSWLHLLMSLIFCTKETTLFHIHIVICYELLKEGMRIIVQNRTQKSLLEYSVFMPFGLAVLINFQLQDVPRASPDISETYWEYLKRLVSLLNDDRLRVKCQQPFRNLISRPILWIEATSIGSPS